MKNMPRKKKNKKPSSTCLIKIDQSSKTQLLLESLGKGYLIYLDIRNIIRCQVTNYYL